MLASIALLLAFQLLGEVLRWLTGMPMPGAVIGMLLLLAWLAVRPRERIELDRTAGWLIARLSVMFMPAAVGIIEQGPLLSRYGAAIAMATIVSTLLTLTVVVIVFRAAAPQEADGP